MKLFQPRRKTPNETRKELAEDNVHCFLSEYHELNGQIPRIAQLRRETGSGYNVAKRVSERFLHDLICARKQKTYIEYLISRSDLVTPFNPEHQDNIDIGCYALSNSFPNELFLLTVTCPTDDEYCYLVLSQHSKLADVLIQQFLREQSAPYYVYHWELQTSERLHFHALCHIPNNTNATHVLEERLAYFWFAQLKTLGETWGCDFFKNESESACDVKGFKGVNLTPFFERPDQIDFARTYLSSDKKHGIKCDTARYINILDGRLVSPKSHYGLSKALKELVTNQTFKTRILFKNRSEAEDLYDYLQKLINTDQMVKPWAPLFSMDLHGEKCRLKRDQYSPVFNLFRKILTNFANTKVFNPEWKLHVNMDPRREVKLFIRRYTEQKLPCKTVKEPKVKTYKPKATGFNSSSAYECGLHIYKYGFPPHQWKDAAFYLGQFFWRGNKSLNIPPLGDDDDARHAEILKVIDRYGVEVTDQMRTVIWEMVRRRTQK